MEEYNFKNNLKKIITLKDYLFFNKTSKDLIIKYPGSSLEQKFQNILNDNPTFLFSGTNDYRKYKRGEPIFIPISSAWGAGVFGNGLYTTPNFGAAKDYAEGIALPLILGGQGCSKNIFIRTIKVKDNKYDKIKGIILQEKKNYTEDEWNFLIKDDINFIVNGTDSDGSELVFIKNKDNLLIYDDPILKENENCNQPYNYYNFQKNHDILKQNYHECLDNDKIKCPSTCNYLKARDQLPYNNDGTRINCGTDEYKIKYLKYKIKYLKLKQFIYNRRNH